MKGTYEIKSRATGKAIYSAYADDIAKDWNDKRKLLMNNWETDKKLKSYVDRYGLSDLYLTIPVEAEIIEPEIEPKVVKKRTHKRK
jgi:hypothetical protein